jgi:SelR domain
MDEIEFSCKLWKFTNKMLDLIGPRHEAHESRHTCNSIPQNNYMGLRKTDKSMSHVLLTISLTLYCGCRYRPFSGKYLHENADGDFTCVVCDSVLFRSDQKFESGCGWPSFSDVQAQGTVDFRKDTSNGEKLFQIFLDYTPLHLLWRNPYYLSLGVIWPNL